MHVGGSTRFALFVVAQDDSIVDSIFLSFDVGALVDLSTAYGNLATEENMRSSKWLVKDDVVVNGFNLRV